MGKIILIVAMLYANDMAKIPNDNEDFYDVDHHLCHWIYNPPTLDAWLEYQGQIKECGSDCQLVDLRLSDARYIVISRI